MQKRFRLFLHALSLFVVLILSLGSVARPTMAAAKEPYPDFRIQIPAINLDRPVIRAYAIGNTWDFGPVRQRAAYLEGRPLPGSGSNVAIGAHVELAKRRPGPFYRLKDLKPGDEITVTFKGEPYHYRVEKSWITTADDPETIMQTSTEVLTLFTCTDYSVITGLYYKRQIVRASRFNP